MANEIKLGSNFEVFYFAETLQGRMYGNQGGETTDYIALGVINNAKITFNKEIIETKGINSDSVTENQYGKEYPTITMDGELTTVLETLLDYFDAATEQSFSIIFKQNTDRYYYVLGCVLDKIKLSTNVGEVIKINFEITGMSYESTATDPLSASEPGENSDYGTSFAATKPTLWTSSVVEKVAASGWTNTGDVNEASGWEISAEYNATPRWHLDGNTTPRRVQRVGLTTSGKFTTDFENVNQMDELTGDKQGTIKFMLNAPTDSKFIQITKCRFEPLDLDVSEMEMIEQEVSFKGSQITIDVTP